MSPSGLAKGLLALLGLALVLFTFNHARLLAREAATRRLDQSREEADRVQAAVEARVLEEARRLATAPEVAASLEHAEPAAAVAATRRQGLEPTIGLQVVSVDDNLRVTTSGTFKRAEIWDSMREALETGLAAGIERDEESGALAVTAAVLNRTPGRAATALAIARPLGPDFVDAVKAATGLDASIYTPDGVRRATTLLDEDGSRASGEPAASVPWRRWERRQRAFVTATVSRAAAFDPIRSRQGGVVAVRELTAPLDYELGFRRLAGSRRFLVEVLFLGLAAVMALLLARSARDR
ncbi:MAG TPA: cache domain-containing protein [Thermodesulfobacteriota bacterium]